MESETVIRLTVVTDLQKFEVVLAETDKADVY